MRRILLLILLGGLLAGCASAEGAGTQVTLTLVTVAPLTASDTPQAVRTPTHTDPAATAALSPKSPALPTGTASPAAGLPGNDTSTTLPDTPVPAAAPTERPTLGPGAWKELPVIPELSPHAVAVIQDSIARGNNPRSFSKIGDCESRTSWFLGDFDLGPKNYALGPYEADFQPVVDYYHGSFNRLSMAARPGFTSASVMSLLWTDPKECQKGETPLACEYRLNKPVLAFIMLGTNDASNPKTFEGHMRKIIEYSLSQGVLPVLGTKADNVEGDESINATIARLAFDYDIPLWNYWRAVQDLPDHGLQSDGQHLTFGPTRFDDPANMEKAWPVRNLNAMQLLKQVMDQTTAPNP